MTDLELAVHSFAENLGDLIMRAKEEAAVEFAGAKRSLEQTIAGLRSEVKSLEDQLDLKDQELIDTQRRIAAFGSQFADAFGGPSGS
jgi:phage shock protein A